MAEGSNVQHIAELGVDLGTAYKQLEEFSKYVEQMGVTLNELSKNNWNLEATISGISNAGSDAQRKLAEEALKANDAFKQQAESINSVHQSTNNYLGVAARLTGIYSGWQLTNKAIRETLSTLNDVESRMVEIGRVFNATTEETKYLRDSLFEVSQAMANTFDETSMISKRFAQAGYHDMAENIELTRVALLAMNTAELNAVSSTNSLVGILKQWNLEAEDLITVVDKLNYTADNNATTTQDLVDAFLRSSSAAKNAKISFDELAGVVVTLAEATGRSGKELGTAVNSLIAFTTRASSIKVFENLGVTVWLDEQKTSLNSVMDIWQQLSDLYKTNGEQVVNVLASQTDMTELFAQEVAEAADAMDEYNKVIETQNKLAGNLNDAERKLLTEQFGVYRRNYVIALLEDFGKIQEVVEDMDNAMGHSERQNEAYLATLEAKVKQLVASLQQLAIQLGDSGLLEIAKLFVDAATAAATLAKNTGGLVPVIVLLATAFTRLKNEATQAAVAAAAANTATAATAGNVAKVSALSQAMATLKTASVAAGGGIAGVGATLNTLLGPIGWITLGIQTLIGAYSLWNHSQEKSRQAALESVSAYSQESKALEGYSDKVAELRKRLDEGNLSHEESISVKKELLTIQNDLIDKYGIEAASIDLVNGSLSAQLDILKNLSKEKASQLLTENVKEFDKAVREMEKERHFVLGVDIYTGSMGEELDAEFQGLIESFESKGLKKNPNGDGFSLHLYADADEAQKTLTEFSQAVRDFQTKYGLQDDYNINQILGFTSDSYNQAKSVLNDYADLYKQFIISSILTESDRMVEGQVVKGASAYYDEAIKAAERYNDAILSGDEAQIKSTQAAFDNLRQEIESAYGEGHRYLQVFDEIFDSVSDGMIRFKNALNADNELSSLAEKIKDIGLSLDELDLAKLGGDNAEIYEQLAEKADKYSWSVENLIRWLAELGYIQGAELLESTDELTESYDQLIEKIDLLESAMKSLADGKGLDIEKTLELLEKYPELANAIHFVGDEWYFEADAMEAARKAKHEMLIATQQQSVQSQIAQIAEEKLRGEIEKMFAEYLNAADGASRYAIALEILKAAERDAAIDAAALRQELISLTLTWSSLSDMKPILDTGYSYRGNADAIKQETEALKKQTDAINDSIKALQKEQKESDKVYKKKIEQLQKEKKLQDELDKDRIKALQEEQKQVNKLYQDRIKALQSELKEITANYKAQEEAVKKRYNAEIEALRKLKQEENRSDDEEDYNRKRDEILRKIAEEEKRTGREATESIKSLKKELEELDRQEERRLRNNAIDDQISDIEKRRDAELEAIKKESEAEKERYDNLIENLQRRRDEEKENFDARIKIMQDEADESKKSYESQIEDIKEKQQTEREALEARIEGLREQIEAAKKASESQIKNSIAVGESNSQVTRSITEYFSRMYQAISDRGHSWVTQAMREGENLLTLYTRIFQTLQQATNVGIYGPPNINNFPSYFGVKSSHTGSLITGDGLVNVKAAELVVRDDISAGLMRTNKFVEQMYNNYHNSYANSQNNSRNYQFGDINLNGGQFGNQRQARQMGRSAAEEIKYNLDKMP